MPAQGRQSALKFGCYHEACPSSEVAEGSGRRPKIDLSR
jgi:hypothetical protein